MNDEERSRIEREAREEAKHLAKLESRIEILEQSMKRIWLVIGAAAMLIGTSIWDGLKAVLFK